MATPHILVIPFPAQGHLIPLLDLTVSAAASTGAVFTILTTPSNLPLIAPILSSSSSSSSNNIHALTLPLPPHPSLPPGAEHVRTLPSMSSVAALIRSLSRLCPDVVSWANSLPDPPTAVLSDFFLGWTRRLAGELSVPRLAFFSSGALLASLFDHLFMHGPRVPPPDPPVPAFPYRHLPSLFRRYESSKGDDEGKDWEFVRSSMLDNRSAYAAVFNTLEAMEGKYVRYLQETYGHDRVWAVGPVSAGVPAGAARGGESSVAVEEVTGWLDGCPERSVVYVCFGSQFRMGREQAGAIAAGIETSGARFVWCVGSSEVDGGGEFERRTEGNGLVIRGWAPQMAILRHRAVGAFLTHCGWNSVLEGVVNGVVLLTWPMEADQFVNARLLVEETRIGLAACEGGPGVLPETEQLGRVLAESVDEGKCPEVKRRVAEMRRRAAEAVAEGGSSWRDMMKLRDALCEIKKN